MKVAASIAPLRGACDAPIECELGLQQMVQRDDSDRVMRGNEKLIHP